MFTLKRFSGGYCYRVYEGGERDSGNESASNDSSNCSFVTVQRTDVPKNVVHDVAVLTGVKIESSREGFKVAQNCKESKLAEEILWVRVICLNFELTETW